MSIDFIILGVAFLCTYIGQLLRLQERLQSSWVSKKITSKRQVILYLIPLGFIPLTIHLVYTKVVTEIRIFRHYFDRLP
jgi:membrane-anchored glycerophosphoryl diester phosphodiesterase (GDPDase)